MPKLRATKIKGSTVTLPC